MPDDTGVICDGGDAGSNVPGEDDVDSLSAVARYPDSGKDGADLISVVGSDDGGILLDDSGVICDGGDTGSILPGEDDAALISVVGTHLLVLVLTDVGGGEIVSAKCSVPSFEYHGRSFPPGGLCSFCISGPDPVVSTHLLVLVLTDVAGGEIVFAKCSVPSFEYHGRSVPPDAYGSGFGFSLESNVPPSWPDDVESESGDDSELDNSTNVDFGPRDDDACVNL